MIKVEKLDREEFSQCSSCLKSTEDIDIYKIEVGKINNQTLTLRLCHECLINLGDQIYDIYKETTDFLDKNQ